MRPYHLLVAAFISTQIFASTYSDSTDDSDSHAVSLRQVIIHCIAQTAHVLNEFGDVRSAFGLIDAAQPLANTKTLQSRLELERGNLYFAQYDWDAATSAYNRAIILDPSNADAYYWRGLLRYSALTDQVARQSALNDFLTYLDLAPDASRTSEVRRYIAIIHAEIEALGTGGDN